MFKFRDIPYDESVQYSNFIAHEFDNCLEFSLGIKKEMLDSILPSDPLFYKKVTSNILPNEKDHDAATEKILEIGLLSKADKYYEPTEEQMNIIKKFIAYMHPPEDNEAKIIDFNTIWFKEEVLGD